MIQVQLPAHLRALAGTGKFVDLAVDEPVTIERVIDALEAAYPSLRGTIREHGSGKRRPMVRFFACEEDLSHESVDSELPEPVRQGKQPFIILGAISGGAV